MRELVDGLRQLARANGEHPVVRRRQSIGVLGVAAAAGLLAVAVVGASLVFRSSAPTAAPPTQYVQLTNFADSATSPALSPDGRYMAFIRGPSTLFGPGEIYVKALPDGDPVQLTDDHSEKFEPQFTPDGAAITFSKGIDADSEFMDTWIVPARGGPARLLLANA